VTVVRDTSHLRAAQAQVLSDLALIIAQTPDLSGALAAMIERARAGLDFDRCTLALLDDGDAQAYRLHVLFDARPGASRPADGMLPLASDIIGAVIRNRQPRLIADLSVVERAEMPAADPATWDGSLAVVLSAPLVAHGDTLGAVTFGAEKQESLSADDVDFASAIAAHLAQVIARQRRDRQLERAQRELARLGSFPELNPAAIVEMDLAGRIHYFNPAAKRLIPDCCEGDFSSPLLDDLLSLLGSLRGEPGNLLVREIKLGDVWYQQVLQLVLNGERIRSFVLDITERKRVEEALQRQNEYLAAST
jgi:GAF domain-containing protein